MEKVSSYIAQYPVLTTIQSAVHFTSLTDLFTQTPSWLLWEAFSHMLQLMHEGGSYTYPPLSIARYSFIQLSEWEQCRMKKLAKGFNTAAQDSNLGSRSRESEALPLTHCTPRKVLWGSPELLEPIRPPLPGKSGVLTLRYELQMTTLIKKYNEG